jgi:nucleotide-binding universal stress UspA family protein
LVPLDASPSGASALPYAQLMSSRMGVDVELFHALPSLADRMRLLLDGGFGGAPATREIARSILAFDQMERIQARVREAAQEKLEQMAATFPAGSGTTVRSVVSEGQPAEAIATEAAKSPGTLLIMASHGRPGSVRWWLGSVTDKVIHLSSAPTLVVPPREGDTGAPARIDEIVLPLDGSVLAEAAIPHAAFLAKTFHAPVHVLQAVYLEETWWGGLGQDELNEPIAEAQKYARKYVEDVVLRLQGQGVEKADGEVAHAHPVMTISDAAERCSHPLIVMSTRGHGGMARITMGSVTNRCLHQSAAPILLVHP